MSSLLQEGSLFHGILEKKLAMNEKRVNVFKSFTQTICTLLKKIAQEIQCEGLHLATQQRQDPYENQGIAQLSRYLSEMINSLGLKLKEVSCSLQAEIVAPLAHYETNQLQNHKEVLRVSEEIMFSLKANNDLLKELRKNVQASTQSKNPLAMKNMIKELYDNQIQKIHDKWQELREDYRNVITMIDCANSNRCNFTLKLKVRSIKILNQMLQIPQVEECLEQYEQTDFENVSLSLAIKEQMRQKMSQAMLFQDSGEVCSMEGLGRQTIALINDFIGQFTSRSVMRSEQKCSYEQARGLILDEIVCKKYFLQKLKATLQVQTKLPTPKYRELTTLFKYIFAMLNEFETEDLESVIYNLLFVASRIKCSEQYLINELGRHKEYWRSYRLWENLISYISSLRTSQSRKQKNKFSRLHNIFNLSLWNRKKEKDLKTRSIKIIEDYTQFDILCEVNHFMAGLEVEEHFVFEFILSMAQKYILSTESIRKLMEHHYFHRINITNRMNSAAMCRKNRIEKSYRKLLSYSQKAAFCIGISVHFLDISPKITNLLLVCKTWHHLLREKIFKRYLILNSNYLFLTKNRRLIYLAVCRPLFKKTVYEQMRNQLPSSIDCKQIIQLDARRSLSWNTDLREKMAEVLIIFAYYHTEVGYLQGMNYLCENILKITTDTYQAYTIFQSLMSNQYDQLYTGTFEGLRLKIYQFMRLVQRERPNLFQHLRDEKLEGEHFLLPWAITLWGEMSGQLSWVLWDGFILQGWEWWFKTMLWLLQFLEPELLSLNFEELMKCFSDLHQTLFAAKMNQFKDYGIKIEELKMQINEIIIQEELLQDMQKQHRMKVETINHYMERIQAGSQDNQLQNTDI